MNNKANPSRIYTKKDNNLSERLKTTFSPVVSPISQAVRELFQSKIGVKEQPVYNKKSTLENNAGFMSASIYMSGILFSLGFAGNAIAGTPQSSCPSQNITWGEGCSGTTINHTGSVTNQYNVDSTNQNFSGSVTVKCDTNQPGWTYLNSSCTRKQQPNSPPTTAAGQYDGRFTSNAGADSTSIGPMGTFASGAPPAQVACSAQNVNWSASGFSCQGFATSCPATESSPGGSCAVPGGSNALVEDSQGRGSANYACNGTNGQFEVVAGSEDCGPVVACPSQTFNWNNGGASCTATGSGNANQSVTFSNNGGNTGTITVECVQSTTSPSGFDYQVISSNCAPTPVTVNYNCPGISKSWSTCNGSNSAASSQTVVRPNVGTSSFYTAPIAFNNSTPGYTGAAYSQCGFNVSSTTTSGTNVGGFWAPGGTSVAASPASSCAPISCPAQTVNWTSGSTSCSGSAGSAPFAASSGSVTSTNGNTGNATFTCSATGTYTYNSGTCAAPVPSACPATTLGWTVSGNTCTGPINMTPSGSSNPITSNNGNSGNASFSCLSGSYSQISGATCSAPPAPVSCPATTLGWTVSGNACSGSIPATAHTGSNTVTSTSGNNGTASFLCTNGAYSQNGSPAAACTLPSAPSTPASFASQINPSLRTEARIGIDALSYQSGARPIVAINSDTIRASRTIDTRCPPSAGCYVGDLQVQNGTDPAQSSSTANTVSLNWHHASPRPADTWVYLLATSVPADAVGSLNTWVRLTNADSTPNGSGVTIYLSGGAGSTMFTGDINLRQSAGTPTGTPTAADKFGTFALERD